MQRYAAQNYCRRTVIEVSRQGVFQPIAGSAFNNISTCKRTKHHYDTRKRNVQCKFVRMYSVSKTSLLYCCHFHSILLNKKLKQEVNKRKN